MWSQLRSSASDGDAAGRSGKSSAVQEGSEEDPLDELLKEVQVKEEERRNRPARVKNGSPRPCEDEEPAIVIEDSVALSEFMGLLEELRMDLASPEVDVSLRKRLSTIDDESFVKYYQENPSLREYTLVHEMSRNVYEKDGRRIVEFPQETDDLVVRMANQSIFADVISALSSGISGLSRVGASVCACDRGGRYEIIRDRALKASLDLCVSVPALGLDSHKLRVATFPCHIFVSLDEIPTVRREIGRVQLATLFDDDLRKAAAFHVQASEKGTDFSSMTATRSESPPPPQQLLVGSSHLLRAAANSVKKVISSSPR